MIRFFDMFSGIGGFRAGLERAGGYKCVGHCEIDAFANRSYNAVFDTENEVFFDDATKINPKDIPDFDILCAGFPCQAFSVAGRRRGFEDARGTLIFEIVRVLGEKRPKYFLLENVPGLLNHDKGRTFTQILIALSDLGYQTIYKLAYALDISVDTLIENQFKKDENELVYELMQKLDYLSDDDIKQLLGYADCLIERQRIRKRIV